MDKIEITKLNFEEAARYLGYKGNTPESQVLDIMNWAAKKIIDNAIPRYLYKKFPINTVDKGIEVAGTSIVLTGNSAKLHLKGCNYVYLICATLSGEIDRLIRIT